MADGWYAWCALVCMLCMYVKIFLIPLFVIRTFAGNLHFSRLMLATVPVLVSTSGKDEIIRDLCYGCYVDLEGHCPKGVQAYIQYQLGPCPSFHSWNPGKP